MSSVPETSDEAMRRRLKEILARPDLPAFSEHIQQILRCTSDDSTSIRHVVALVLREYSVAAKLLRTSNSPLYNRSGRSILSVSHAASLLGLQAIRDVAASMILFDHYGKTTPGLRQLMVLSLLTANHARELASVLGFPRVEEAYLCGMFRNLGEVLLACYLPIEYNRILAERKHHKLSERNASRKVLHFSYEDIGRAMVEHWGMPDCVKECLHEPVSGGRRITAQHRSFLGSLVAFSHTLTDCVYRAEAAGDPRVRTNRLRESFHAALGISPQQLDGVLKTSIAEANETSRTLRIPLDSLRLKQQIEAALSEEPSIESEDPDGPDVIQALKTRVEAGAYDLNDMLLTVLENIFHCGSFDRALFALSDPGSSSIQGRLAVGDKTDTLISAFRFPLSIRGGPIALSIIRKADLFRFGLSPGVVDPFSQTLGSVNFALCPIVADGVVVGCIFCDRVDPRQLTTEQKSRIQAFRDVAALAIRKRHR
jgi:HD-like signal output (HDOD) protein